MRLKAAITGLGVVHALGQNLETFWAGLRDGAPLPASGGVLGLTLEHPENWISEAWLRRMGKDAQMLVVAAKQAIARAGEGLGSPRPAGMTVSTNLGSFSQVYQSVQTILVQGPDRLNPMEFPNAVLNAANGYASIECGLKGYNDTLAGWGALGEACDALLLGRVDQVLVGGMEEAAGPQSRMVPGRAVDQPRPFSPGRQGLWLGEGAAALVMESEVSARSRGAGPCAWLTGWGASYDAAGYDRADPAGRDLSRAIRLAIAQAEIGLGAIDGVVGFSDGTETGDSRAARALHDVWGGRLAEMPLFAMGGALGSLEGAAEAFGAVCAGLILARGEWPASPWHAADSSLPRLRVAAGAEPFRGQRVLLALTDRFGANYAYCLEKA